MLFYLTFYLGYRYCRHKILSIEISIVIVSVLLAFFIKDDVWYSSNISFGVGILIRTYEDRIACFSKPIFYFFIVGGFTASVAIYMLSMSQNQAIYLIFKILASAFWLVLVLGILILYKIGRILVLEIIGRCTLECYLLHGFIFNLFKSLNLEPIIILCISLLTTLICAYAIYSMWVGIRSKERVLQ